MKHLIGPCFGIPGCAPSSALATLQVGDMPLLFLVLMHLGGTRQRVFTTFILLRFCEVRARYSPPPPPKKPNLKKHSVKSFSWWRWWFWCRAPVSDGDVSGCSVLQGPERKGSDLSCPYPLVQVKWDLLRESKESDIFSSTFHSSFFFSFFPSVWFLRYPELLNMSISPIQPCVGKQPGTNQLFEKLQAIEYVVLLWLPQYPLL